MKIVRSPLFRYVGTWCILLLLSAATFGLAFTPSAPWLAVSMAMAIAALKAFLVLWVFMHLDRHTGSARWAVVVALALVLLLVALTLVDVSTRIFVEAPWTRG